MEHTSRKTFRRVGVGVESKMDFLSIFSLIVFFFIFAFGIYSTSRIPQEYSVYWVVINVAVLVQGVILWILFQAGADAIRLLKKLNSLPYSGVIAGSEFIMSSNTDTNGQCLRQSETLPTNEIDENICPKCGKTLGEDSNYCSTCNEYLE